MLVEWQVAARRGKGAFNLEPFDSIVKRACLNAHALPNPARPDLEALQSGVHGAVQAMRCFMVERQGAFALDISARLRHQLEDLEKLQQRQLEELGQRVPS